ncbi:hypothetical protein ES705_23264 [subsurface metagenome]
MTKLRMTLEQYKKWLLQQEKFEEIRSQFKDRRVLKGDSL